MGQGVDPMYRVSPLSPTPTYMETLMPRTPRIGSQLRVHFAAIAIAAAAGQGPASAQAQPPAPSEVRVALEATYPPFESYQDGAIVGFDPDMAALLGREMRLKPVLMDVKFANLILGLSGGQHDVVISGMYITKERLQQADAVPYAITGAVIMVNKDSTVQPKSEKDLCGVKLGLQAGTAWVKKIHALSQDYCIPNGKQPVQLLEFPTAPEVSQALMSRNIQAQMDMSGVAKMIIERSRGRIAISSSSSLYPETLGIYVKKGNVELRTSIEKALAVIRATGEYDTLIKRYDLTPVTAH